MMLRASDVGFSEPVTRAYFPEIWMKFPALSWIMTFAGWSDRLGYGS